MARIGLYREWLEEDKLILLRGWARNGLTDADIAHNIGISVGTLYEWKKKYVELAEALKEGKEVADLRIENALYQKALGYDADEIREEYEGNICVKKTVIHKHYAPDTTAQIYWLKNRRPENWRDKPQPVEVEISADDGLLEALSKSVDADMSDDSDFLPSEEE